MLERPYLLQSMTVSLLDRARVVWRSQGKKGSGDMAVPKLFYFLNSGSGQLKYLRSRVRPRNWTQGSSMDDMRYSVAFAES